MLDALSDAAWRRPWALLGAAGALLAALLATAVFGVSQVGAVLPAVGDDGGDGAVADADVVVVTRAGLGADSRVYRVALDVMTAGIEADVDVEKVTRGPVSDDKETTSLLVTLSSDDAGTVAAASERISEEIDPGPLKVSIGGETQTALAARDAFAEDVWRLELLILPLVALVLVATFGLWYVMAPLVAALGGVAGGIAALVLMEAVAGASLLGAAPAAVVGLVLGIELPAVLVARFRDEAGSGTPREALEGALHETVPGLLAAAGCAALVPFALLLTPLEGAASIAVGCAGAAWFGLASVLLATPALIRLGSTRAGSDPDVPLAENRYTRSLRAVPRLLARSWVRTGAAVLVVTALLLAAASPALDGSSRAFGPADLPSGTEARTASTFAEQAAARGKGGEGDERPAPAGEQEAGGESLYPELPPAALAALVIAGAGLGVAARSPRGALLAPAVLLPPAAAAGLAWLVFGEGTVAGLLGQERQGVVETGALAALAAALTGVCAGRSALALDNARVERALDPGAQGVAERAAGMTLPASVAGTLAAAAASAVLVGTDLLSAREFGLAVAAGLLLDLLLVRSAFVAAAARLLGASLPGRPRPRLGWPGWLKRRRRPTVPQS
jgi:uncharacterized membrane protein YdfJ with MMPL/SSD domain